MTRKTGIPMKTIEYGEKKESAELRNDWWQVPDEELHKHVRPVIDKIEQQQSARRKRSLFFARLYENEELLGFQPGKYRASEALSSNSNRLTLNVVKSCTDTLLSKIGTAKPKPMALTHNENWTKQKRAEKLTDYLEGLYSNINMWGKGALTFRDGCALGTGALKLHSATGKIGVDRVLVDEIIVDEVEAMYGEPRQKHQRKYITKEVLKAMFPRYKKQIEAANDGEISEAADRTTSHMLLVYESWHLPSGKDKDGKATDDGRHCVTIQNCTLFAEKWTKDWFPFVYFRYTDKILGFYGGALSEEISGIQLEINKLLRNIAIAQHLMAVPQTWLNNESKVVTSQLSNQYGALRYYIGSPPVFMTPGAMSMEVYNHLETLYRRAFEITGISQLSAQGAKPSGITANSALRTMQDIESDRFKWTSQKYEKMFLDAAPMIIEMNEDLYKNNDKLRVSVAGKKGIKQLNWADVRMDIEDFSLRLYPSSLLPSEPGGQLQTVTELMQAEMITKEEGMSLMDFPDVKAVTSLKTAGRDVAMMMIGKMLDEGVYIAPEPYMNLELSMELTQTSYLKAKIENAPSNLTDLLQTFMDDIDALIDERDKALPLPDADPNALPDADPNALPDADPNALPPPDPNSLAAGMPPPESELLPFAS